MNQEPTSPASDDAACSPSSESPTNTDKMNNENYTPYGEEWEKEAMKNRKAGIVDMLRKACMERENLRQWKDEAMQVLGEWETTWIAAGSPGRLGQSKAEAALEKWEAGAAEILPPGANPSEAEVAKMFFDSFEELKAELAAARKALMVCDGAMMGKVNPKSVAFKMVNAILRPENV